MIRQEAGFKTDMLLCLIVVFLFTVKGQERPTIEGAISNVTVTEYRDATLKCNIRTIPTLTSVVKWIKIDSKNPILISVGNTTQTASSRYKVDLALINNRGTSSLIIQNASRTDAGRYRCILRTQGVPYTEWPQRDGFLFINVLPRIFGGIGNTSALLSKSAMINCNVMDMTSSESVVQWVKLNEDAPVIISVGESMMVKNGKYKVTMSTEGDMTKSTLVVQNLAQNDTGKYRCIVQTRGINFREWSQSEGFLAVKDWPTIQGEINNQTAEEYDDGRLYCNVKDLTPTSQVRWAKIDKGTSIMISVGDNLKSNMEKYRVELTTSNDWSISSLTITSVTKKDAGRFRCLVETEGLPYSEWPQKDGFLYVKERRRWNNENGRNDSSRLNFNFVFISLLLTFKNLI